jgi:suppressor of G2 allele of SKP1
MTDNLTIGTKHLITCNYNQAIESFSKLIDSETSTEQVLGYLYRGTCYIETDAVEKAIKDFNKGLEINKNSFELKFKLGIALFKSNQYEAADQMFRAALISSTNSEEREKLVLWQSKTKIETDILAEIKAKKVGNVKFSNNWFQTDDAVIVTLDSNIVLNKTIISVKLEKRCIAVYYEEFKVYEIILGNAINNEASTYKVLTQKIEIKLVKDTKGLNWITLDEKSKTEVQKYPTSMKKDFNQINKQIDSELKKEEVDPSGNDAMMHLFKEIYANASEETKRAMQKSYATSGGTVLSTNWDEVKTKDYEGKDRPEAPLGQVWVDEKK